MTKTTKILLGCGLFIISLLFILTRLPQKQTAGYYLNQIVELRKEKQAKIRDIAYLDMKINQYKEKMNAIQYSGLDYLGLSQESGITPIPTAAEVLTDQPIE